MTSSRAATTGWVLAASVYLLAVLHRTSLGVAGLLAAHRFDIGPAQLSVFIFLQLGVYAAMQVPAGVLVDRYGPRRVLTAAALVMGTAQLVFALVPSFPVALLARGLLGSGDALTFISVLRFAATHFDARRYPLIVSVTAMFGMVGNVAATLPLAVLLRSVGWEPTFAVAAGLSLVLAVAVRTLPDSTPPARAVRSGTALRASADSVARRVRASWGLPGTRLGFWTHFTAMSTGTALGVLWGAPYLVEVLDFSASGAGGVLMAGVITSAISSPLLGWLIGHHPAARVPIAVSVSALTIAGFVVLVAALGDHPPAGYVVPLFVLAILGGPASMVAFAVARDYNHGATLGTASGVVNVGGFVATVVVALGIGWTLDLLGGTDAHTLRQALLVAVAVQAFGLARTVTWWLRVRSQALGRQDRGEPVPVAVVRHRFDLAGSPAGDGPA